MFLFVFLFLLFFGGACFLFDVSLCACALSFLKKGGKAKAAANILLQC